MKDTSFICQDYHSYDQVEGCLIYCDPPYQGTTGYDSSRGFDHDDFWETMRKWSENNIVLISEQNAPDDFECIWEQEVSRSINATGKSRAVEKLFKWKGKQMKREKEWMGFKDSGLLWWTNMILQTFGWSICCEMDDENKIQDVYPERVEFRGFPKEVNTDGYIKVSNYLKENADTLLAEALS